MPPAKKISIFFNSHLRFLRHLLLPNMRPVRNKLSCVKPSTRRQQWKKAIASTVLIIVCGSYGVNASATQSSRESSTHIFNIPSLKVEQALSQLAETSGHQLLFSYSLVNSLNSNAVQGKHTVPSALQQMLQNTPLTGHITERGVIIITDASAQNNSDKGRGNMNVNHKTKKTVLATVIGMFAVGGMATASAEDQAEQQAQQSRIDEVIVTAQKREQRLLDVPISISVVSDKDMKLLGIDNMTDLSYYVPNLTITETSPGDQDIKIRGVSNFNGSSPLVGVYLDELPLRLSTGPQIDIPSTDIERVEVLKGPQGTLFGQGAVGGVIRYISKTPSFEGFSGDVSAKTYNTKGGDMSNEITTAANIPVLADKLAFRVAASYKNKGGWIDQFPAGRENANDEAASNIRIKGLFLATEDFTINTTLIRNRSEAGNSNLINVGSSSESKYFKLTPALEERGDTTISTERTYDYEVYNITASYDFEFATLLSSSTKYDIESNEGAYTSMIRWAPGFHIPESDLQGSLNNIINNAQAYGQEIRLSGDTDSLKWVLGIQYTDIELTTFSANTGVWLNESLDILSTRFSAPLSSATLVNESVAVFSDASYSLTDQLTVSFGARYYEDEVSLSNSASNQGNDFENLSLKGSLSYALSDQANLYFTIAEGFRSGGINLHSSSLPPYGPESLISYEFGGKAILFDGGFSVDASAYFSDYSNYQAQDLVNTAIGPAAITVNPGKAQLKGIEWTLSAHFTDQFQVGFNGHISEGEFTDVSENQAVFLSGDSLGGVPKYSYSVSADYTFNWSSSIEGFAHVNYSRHGESGFTNRSFAPVLADFGPVTESPEVGYLGAQIGAKWNSLTLKLFGKNLNNELREANEGDLFNSLQRRPRSIGIEASYSF